MYELIYTTLTADGFDVYAPGQHEGICKQPYVVVKDGGGSPFLTSLAYETVDIMVYCPLAQYSKVKPYLYSVMQSLRAIGQLKNTHVITPSFTDTDKKAHMMSVKYQVFKRRQA